MKIPAQYRKSVLIALALHIALLIFMITRFAPTLYRAPTVYQPKPFDTISAVAVLPQAPEIVPRSNDKAELEKIEKQKAIEKQKVIEKQEVIAKKEAIAKQEAIQKVLQQAKLKAEQLAQKKAAAIAAQKKAKAQARIAAAQKRARQQALLTAKQRKLQQQMMMQQLTSEEKDLTQIQTKEIQGKVDQYKAQILALIQSNWRIEEVNKNLKCVYMVSLAPDGTVLSATLTQSSGNDSLDQSAHQAIMVSSPLPVPQDPALFAHFRQIVLTLSPQGYLAAHFG